MKSTRRVLVVATLATALLTEICIAQTTTSRQQSACIRTLSLRTRVSISGKPNFVSGDKEDKTSRRIYRDAN
jgi:hypothetical protein